jgi:hypothetical protein
VSPFFENFLEKKIEIWGIQRKTRKILKFFSNKNPQFLLNQFPKSRANIVKKALLVKGAYCQ